MLMSCSPAMSFRIVMIEEDILTSITDPNYFKVVLARSTIVSNVPQAASPPLSVEVINLVKGANFSSLWVG